jgi:protein-disulfide isomerase
MSRFLRLVFSAGLILIIPHVALAVGGAGYYPLTADDGDAIDNHRVPVALENRIDKLPGVVIVGNPTGKVTLAEFYDVNCPYCRQASAGIDALLHSHRQLRLVLVPFPVLGVASILGTRVELAVARLASPEEFYAFHRKLDAMRGVVDDKRALLVANEIGLDIPKVLKIANEDSVTKIMTAHVQLGNALAIQVTPGFVIKGVAILGYPGQKSLGKMIDSVERCGAVMCGVKTR